MSIDTPYLDVDEIDVDSTDRSPLDPFFDLGLIVDVLGPVKSGKEATVYCCRAGRDLGGGLVAAKVYRDWESRSFKNDTRYREGRVILKERERRAVEKGTAAGRSIRFGMWLNYEYEALTLLARAGADVPRILGRSDNALLMEYFGDEDGPAPLLKAVRLDPDEAPRLFEQVIRNVEIFLNTHYVHADLSPFNILYWQDEIRVIDFPQAVDPRFNRHARDFLEHDLDQVCRYFARYGIDADAPTIAEDLWYRYQIGELG